MIKSLQLGCLKFANNLIQGPLAGISSAPFRLITSIYGKPAFTYTEMISCKTLIHQTKQTISPFIQKLAGEVPLGAQLSGRDEGELSTAVKIVTDKGASLIDLNCGCPVKKIRKRGLGSALLNEPKKIYQLIKVMRENTHLPISIKIRVDGLSQDNNNQELINVIHDSGVDFLIIHGRHWQDTYATPCNYAQIKHFISQLKIPVIGNGDIACIDSLKLMFSTGCQGAMISRSTVGKPWLFSQLMSHVDNEFYELPNNEQIGEIFFQHVSLLAEFIKNEKQALFKARNFCKYYAKNIPNKTNFCLEMMSCYSLNLLKRLCSQYFID